MRKLLLLTLIAAPIPAHADPPSMPSGPPVVVETPAFYRWTVTCSYAGGKSEAALGATFKASMLKMAENDPALAKILAAKPEMLERKPHLQKIEVTKAGKVRVVSTFFTNGKQEECWQDNNSIVTRNPFSNRFSIERIGEGKEQDFPEFAWISEKNFKGIKPLGGVKCMVFEDRIEPTQIESPRSFARDGPIGGEEAIVTATAAVDLETRLPVSIQFRDQLRKYEYPPPPTSVLTMPPEFAAVVQQIEKRSKERNKPLSSP